MRFCAARKPCTDAGSGWPSDTKIRKRKAAGTLKMPGFLSEMIGSENLNKSTHTVGDSTINTTETIVPTSIEDIAPSVVNFDHVIDRSSAGKFALAAIANARPTMNATFWPL